MDTLIYTHEQEPRKVTGPGAIFSEFGEGIKSNEIQDGTVKKTAQILLFRTPKKILPEYEGTVGTYSPDNREMEQNAVIGNIFATTVYHSQQERLANQKTNHELVENIIKNHLQNKMQTMAEEDVKNGVFGECTLWNPRAAEGFGSSFQRSLEEEFFKITNYNESFRSTLGMLYTKMQQNLLTNYGKILKNADNLSHEEFEQQIHQIRAKKKGLEEGGWKKELNNTILIPNSYKKALSSILEAFVEHYVVSVWETEARQRNLQQMEAIKSA